jgi:outer membrane lipoprotein SlyB
MKTLHHRAIVALGLLFTLTLSACYTGTSQSSVWEAQGPPPVRPGRVAWIREVVDRQVGNPVGGALAGALIGGLLGGRGAGAVVGAVGGAAVGAAASSGSSETRTYEVRVQFDDGFQQSFIYPGYSPFRPGQPVVLTPQGLAAM